MSHLADFIVESVTSNLIQLKMNLKLREPIFRIDGQYALDGLIVSLFPLYGSGSYSIQVTNSTICGGAGLSLSPPGIKNLYLDFTFESMEVCTRFLIFSLKEKYSFFKRTIFSYAAKVKFENLLGGGLMQQAVETAVNQLGKWRHLAINIYSSMKFATKLQQVATILQPKKLSIQFGR